MGKPAVFLDRDHTIIADPGYLSDPGAVKLLPGVERAIKSLAGAGYKIVVVTNQSGVARGVLSEKTLDVSHGEMRRQLAAGGAHIDAIYYCPYHPNGTVEQYAIESDLRKPRPGMLLKAAEDMDLDLAQSWMVGDSSRDVEAGQRAGCRTVRLRTGHTGPPGEAMDDAVQADFSARTLAEAAKFILRPQIPRESVRSGLAALVDKDAAQADEDRKAIGEILEHVQHLDAKAAGSLTRTVAWATQVLALPALIGAVAILAWYETAHAQAVVWALVALTLQVAALTFFTISRSR